jgi:acetyl-CoA carboxylase biotin carboxyl carrier protein
MKECKSMAAITVQSDVTGSVWKLLVSVGDKVSQDEPLMYAESMKMEIPVLAPEDGVVSQIHVAEGQAISEGDPVVELQT